MQEESPLVIGFVADLMFTTRIETVARHIDFRVRWIGAARELSAAPADAAPESPGETLHGQSGALIDRITVWQPVLLLVDLTNTAVPWQKWISILKSSPATRRIPIVCFGPHEDVELMQAARKAGADKVLARSRFTADMAALLQKHARRPDHDALSSACDEPLTDLARRGIEMFNAGEYYACHDDLEEAWMQDKGPGRDLYRGILQVGIALYQVQRNNYRGALKMLLRVRQWLQPLPDTCRSVNVAQLRHNVETYHAHITELGPDRLDKFDWDLVAKIQIG